MSLCFIDPADAIRAIADSIGREARRQLLGEAVRAWVDEIPDDELEAHYAKAISELDEHDISMLAAWHASMDVGTPIPNRDYLMGAFPSLGQHRREALKLAAGFRGEEAVDRGRDRGAGAGDGARMALPAAADGARGGSGGALHLGPRRLRQLTGRRPSGGVFAAHVRSTLRRLHPCLTASGPRQMRLRGGWRAVITSLEDRRVRLAAFAAAACADDRARGSPRRRRRARPRRRRGPATSCCRTCAPSRRIELYVQGANLRLSNTIANSGVGPAEIYPEPTAGGDCDGDGNNNNDRIAFQRIFEDSADPRSPGYFVRSQDTVSTSRAVGCMVYHPAHSHWHFEDFSLYAAAARVRRRPGGSLGRRSASASSTPTICSRPAAARPASSHYGNAGCGPSSVEGLSVGWADTYGAYLRRAEPPRRRPRRGQLLPALAGRSGQPPQRAAATRTTRVGPGSTSIRPRTTSRCSRAPASSASRSPPGSTSTGSMTDALGGECT